MMSAASQAMSTPELPAPTIRTSRPSRLDLVIVDLLEGEHRAAAYLKIKPSGKVPVLEHTGFHLWESHAIMQYLADLDARQTVYPRPHSRAQRSLDGYSGPRTISPQP